MLIEKIKAHNGVNGFRFSAGEFCLIALISAPFGIYYLIHGRPLAGVIAIGITANSLVIVMLSLQALLIGQNCIGVTRWFDSEGRATIASRYPNNTRDTFIVVICTLIPFVLLLCAVFEGRPRTQR